MIAKHISYSYAFSHKFTYPDRLQDSVSSPTGWGLQKDSELLEFVNYHLIKMTETGIVNRFRRDAESGEREGPAALERVVVLGFENVAFPFLALLTGLAVAFMQFGIEIINLRITDITQKLRWSLPRLFFWSQSDAAEVSS